MSAYYNENDPHAAQWLRNLIAAGHIAPGEVDERSIEDVTPRELRKFTQCHFFAGIGVWSHALRAAKWCDSRPVWTGSCPCQPFSAAGKGAGFDDERHFWPSWFHLISERKPSVIFGEQVARKGGLAWLDLVQADMEGLGYACGAVPAPAAGFGAPHIRERLYWMADADDKRSQRRDGGELRQRAEQRPSGPRSSQSIERPGPTNGFWRDADWLGCADGKWRPVEPGTFPLADGVASRVDKLRAYGNALCAPQAQAFIEAAMEHRP